MVAEFQTNVVPKIIATNFQEILDNPDILLDWIYRVGEQMDILQANSGSTTGDMKILGNDDIPSDWLLCDGAEFTRLEFPALASFLEAEGNTFNVPNMQAFILDNTTEEFFTLDSPIKSNFTVIIKT